MLENIFDLMCQVPPVTSFQSFLRPHSDHSFHSVTSGTAHKSNSFSSLHSPCLPGRPRFVTFNHYTCLYPPRFSIPLMLIGLWDKGILKYFLFSHFKAFFFFQ